MPFFKAKQYWIKQTQFTYPYYQENIISQYRIFGTASEYPNVSTKISFEYVPNGKNIRSPNNFPKLYTLFT